MRKSTLKWHSKDAKKKEYKTAMGTTDYDIPMFGFKGALFIFISIFLIVNLIPQGTSYILKDTRILNIVLCSPLSGLMIGFSQYFINSKKGFGKGFVMVSVLFTILTGIILFLIYYGGVLA